CKGMSAREARRSLFLAPLSDPSWHRKRHFRVSARNAGIAARPEMANSEFEIATGIFNMTLNFGDIVDAVSRAVAPQSPAFVHGKRSLNWGDATRRMNNIARALHARGAVPGDKVAFYMRNGIEYGELTGACFLGRLTHVNVNYRYKPEEVRYIID